MKTVMGITIYPFMIPFVVAGLIQVLKVIIDVIKHKKFLLRQLFSAGGFPSVHSGISASVATVVRYMSGPESATFAIVVVFSFLFVYDAMNLRYEAGKHAHYLNSLRAELQGVLHKEKVKQFLKERLGHTPLEVVAGIVIGCLVTLGLCNRFC